MLMMFVGMVSFTHCSMLQDDQRLEDYNVDSRVKDFLSNVTSQVCALVIYR